MPEGKKKEFTPGQKPGYRPGRGSKRVDFARELDSIDIQNIIQAGLMESRAYHPERPTTPILNEILHEIKFRLDLLDLYQDKYGEAKACFPDRFTKKVN